MSSVRKYFSSEIGDYVYISLALIIYAVGVTFFILPYEIATGGVTGICSLIYYATGFEVQNSYLIINAFLLVLAIKILGWKFCLKTIYGVLLLTLYLWILQRLIESQYGSLENLRLVGDQTFMAVVIGALCEGIALGISFTRNGSTGGTDIIAAVVNKFRDVSLGQILMILDLVIISSSYFVFVDRIGSVGAWQKIVFGVTVLVISGVTLDYVVNRNRQSVQFMIFSRNYRAIATKLNEKGFGVTVLDGMGWYTKTERKVIVVLVKKRNSLNIQRYIKQIDPYAFVSLSYVQGVYGEGFDLMKAKINQTKPTLVFATNNKHKLEEVMAIIGDQFEIRSLEEVGCRVEIPETSDTLQGNALQKAQFIKKYYGFDCFADDTGLICDALNGEPGVHTARYADVGGQGHDSQANMAKLLKNLSDKDDRSAHFQTSIALIYKGETIIFDGVVNGTIATEKHGDMGFGYDPIFIPEGYDRTFAELSSDIKNTISHRARAVQQLCEYLKKDTKSNAKQRRK